MITAQFGTKKFEVSSNKIYTPDGLSTSEELNYEETEVSGKKPTLNVKGIKLMPLSFEVMLDSRFVDINTEISDWKKLLRGKASKKFTYGTNALGFFYLTKVELKESTLNSKRQYTKVKLSLSFIEDGEYYNGTKSETAKKTTVPSTQKASSSKSTKIKVGSTIKPNKNTRWYETAEGALKKTGKSGKAYQREMRVTYLYSKAGKIVCVNPLGLGWLKVEDIGVIKY